MLIKCPICNKEFKIKKSRFERSKTICCSKECSKIARSEYSKGRNNPNCKYCLDDNLFNNIDCEEKAYILGFIAADGSITKSTISIFIDSKDIDIINKIKNFICVDIPIKSKKNTNLIGIEINSQQMVSDITNLLNIDFGEKSGIIEFPNISNEYKIHFIRGLFDGDGSIRKINGKRYGPECDITNNSYKILESIKNELNIQCSLNNDKLSFSGTNALDFLSKIYDKSTIFLKRKKEIYNSWCSWVPGLQGHYKRLINFLCVKTREDAIYPFKNRASDCGYDLTFIREVKRVSKTIFYGTGLKIKPEYGWYLDIVPRSSISKTGYIFANSVGIIDRSYIGEIIIPLIKIDENMPDLELPCRIMQAVPRPIIHSEFIEVDELSETERGSGGFGSTGS